MKYLILMSLFLTSCSSSYDIERDIIQYPISKKCYKNCSDLMKKRKGFFNQRELYLRVCSSYCRSNEGLREN